MSTRIARAFAVLGALAFGSVFATTATAACSNEALREGQGVSELPACMALEMVSPPKKFTQPAYLPFFSRDGQRLQLIVQTALGDTPGYQYYGGDRYVASRTDLGWTLTATSPLDPAIIGGGRRWGSPAAFTPDLSRWAQIGATQPEYNVGIARLFAGNLDGSFDPLSPLLVPIDDTGTPILGFSVLDLLLLGAAADLSASVLQVKFASTGYLPADPRSTSPAEPGFDTNSYVAFLNEAGEPDLELLARDKDGVVHGGRCGTHLGGEGSTLNQGAISSDGSRIYFSTRPAQPWDEDNLKGPICDTDNGLRILKRTGPSGDATIEEIAPNPSAPGDDLFQGASADGTRVYLMTPRKLTGTDSDIGGGPCSGNLGFSDGCDLYLYDAAKPPGERVTQISDGSQEADVLLSATAISGDGSRAYFVAQGVLSPDTNPEGDAPVAGEPNLYLYENGDGLSFLGTLAPSDAAALWDAKGTGFGEAYAAPFYGPNLEGGGDGHIFAFASKAPLTQDDEDGGFRDVYRYDADSDTLQRISKASAGGSDNGPFDVAVNPAFLRILEYNFGETTRWVSEDGQLVTFATAEALVAGDGDEAMNPYAWHAGQLGAVAAKINRQAGAT